MRSSWILPQQDTVPERSPVRLPQSCKYLLNTQTIFFSPNHNRISGIPFPSPHHDSISQIILPGSWCRRLHFPPFTWSVGHKTNFHPQQSLSSTEILPLNTHPPFKIINGSSAVSDFSRQSSILCKRFRVIAFWEGMWRYSLPLAKKQWYLLIFFAVNGSDSRYCVRYNLCHSV